MSRVELVAAVAAILSHRKVKSYRDGLSWDWPQKGTRYSARYLWHEIWPQG